MNYSDITVFTIGMLVLLITLYYGGKLLKVLLVKLFKYRWVIFTLGIMLGYGLHILIDIYQNGIVMN